MSNFKTLHRYSQENFYEKRDPHQAEMGKKLLDVCLFNVCAFGLKDTLKYYKYSPDFTGFMTKKLKIDTEDWFFEMCMGECAIKGDIKEMEKIESEIA